MPDEIHDYQENYGAGWIKLYRSIHKHWIWQKPLSRFEAWIDMILEANIEPGKINFGNEIFFCDRGEKMYSLDNWAKRWGWSKSKVNRFFNLLEKDSMIERKVNKYTTHLKICNYNIYQDKRNASETQVKRKRNASETQVKSIKELKNDKNDKNDKKKDLADSHPLPFAEIINDLNYKSGKKYKPNIKSTQNYIRARFKEGFILEDFKIVHTNMCKRWKDDPQMDQYLRPGTLYRPSHFEAYLNANSKKEISIDDDPIIKKWLEEDD